MVGLKLNHVSKVGPGDSKGYTYQSHGGPSAGEVKLVYMSDDVSTRSGQIT